MWASEVAPERLAELFHHYNQALTPEVSGKGSEGRAGWKEVPQQEARPSGVVSRFNKEAGTCRPVMHGPVSLQLL
jgi:hypothetical protein